MKKWFFIVFVAAVFIWDMVFLSLSNIEINKTESNLDKIDAIFYQWSLDQSPVYIDWTFGVVKLKESKKSKKQWKFRSTK